MSLALVDDRKGIWPQNLCTPYGIYFSSTPLPSLSFISPVLRRTWWDGVKQDVWRGRVKVETG